MGYGFPTTTLFNHFNLQEAMGFAEEYTQSSGLFTFCFLTGLLMICCFDSSEGRSGEYPTVHGDQGDSARCGL